MERMPEPWPPMEQDAVVDSAAHPVTGRHAVDRDAGERPFLVRAPLRPGPAVHAVAALAVVLGAEISRSFWVAGSEVALIWLPAGLALGLALTFGPRVLAAMALALAAWGMGTRETLGVLWLLPAGGLALAAAVATTALRRLQAAGRLAGPVRELLAFWGLGLAASALISVPPGALAIALQPGFADYAALEIGAAYWISEVFGILVFGPLAARLGAALSERRLVAAVQPARWQLAWLGGLVILAGAQVLLGRSTTPGLADPVVYLYFPLLAVAAGLGTALFQDLVAAAVATGVVSAALVGAAGLEIPRTNFEIIEVVLLVSAFAVMTQLVSAMATALRHHLAQARELARRDFLTGLYNERELAGCLGRAAGGALALLDVPAVRHALDLAGLERTNDIERTVAARLDESVGTGVMLARIGRGLYALHGGAGSDAAVERAVGACYDRLDGLRIREGTVSFTLDPACGVVRLGGGAPSADDRMAMAGQTLAEARAATGRRLHVRAADSVRLETARAEQDLVERLRSALQRPDGFELYAQPIVPLDAVSGRRPFLELLLRLPDGDGEPLRPAAFLDAAARHGLMPDIDRWVLDRALALSTDSRFAVSVNVSGPTLADPALADWIEDRRRAHGARARDVCIEITETEPIRTLAAASGVTAELRTAGYRVVLDDFGTGLASFEYLRTFAFDGVKIDGSFVRAAASPTERSIVEAIQRVAATAALDTTAEFVEDAATRDWLAAIGIDYAQGFLVGGPRPFATTVAALERGD